MLWKDHQEKKKLALEEKFKIALEDKRRAVVAYELANDECIDFYEKEKIETLCRRKAKN